MKCDKRRQTDQSPTEAMYLRRDHYHDQLHTMLKQESSPAYTCTDYLSSLPEYETHLSKPITSFPIDAACRVKMAQWCFQVVDYANFKRSTVSFAITLLDRFLSCHQSCPHVMKSLLCRKTYQLTCMTCLFMAIKTNETADVSGNVFSNLSRDAFVAEDLTSMELKILQTLQWRINGPTPFDLLQYITLVLPCFSKSRLSETDLVNIVELSSFQLDLSVGDYYFMTEKRSTIAIAALCNVLETNAVPSLTNVDNNTLNATAKRDLQCGMEKCDALTIDFLEVFKEELKMVTNANIFSIEIENCRCRLIHLLSRNGESALEQQQQQQSQSQQQQSPERKCSRGKTSMKRNISKVHGVSSATTSVTNGSFTRTPSPDCVSRMTKAEKVNSSKQSSPTSSTTRRTILHQSSTLQGLYQTNHRS